VFLLRADRQLTTERRKPHHNTRVSIVRNIVKQFLYGTLPYWRIFVQFQCFLFGCYPLRPVNGREPMSFDLCVWYPQGRIGNKEAGELYARLCDSDASGVVPHPAIDEFYGELTARHPEIDTIPEERIDDHDHCPWSCKLDHSPGHVIMSCVWSNATYVHQLVQDLARKRGLAIYDPQSDVVTYPDGSTGAATIVPRDRGRLWRKSQLVAFPDIKWFIDIRPENWKAAARGLQTDH
jgi:hypothetical protein